jgi:CheY-like chemotaxis protein
VSAAEESPVRVLVIDDDADQRLILRRLLTRAGADEVVEAGTADDGLAAARGGHFTLVVLDVAMPQRSGIDVLPELHDAAQGSPIVVLSSFPRDLLADFARKRGAVGYVEKRVPPHQLMDEILLAAALTTLTTRVASAHFPSTLTAPSSARSFLRPHLASTDADTIATVELLVSELVANAVVHAASAPRVDVRLAPGTIRVEVHDDDPMPPSLRAPDEQGPGGRGILLLDQLASRWGHAPQGTGKQVWFELDRTPQAHAT